MKVQIESIDAPNLPRIYHRGPPLKVGPLPSVIYFSLSGEESLGLDPYNQPAVFLSENGLRVFSVTLPGHEGAFPHPHAIKSWGNALSEGKNIIGEFSLVCSAVLDYLIEKNYVDSSFIASAGLSRGAYVATYLAANDKRIGTILGFAPLTRFETIKDLKDFKEFKDFATPDLLSECALESLVAGLVDKTLRFYIGNHDTMVGTEHCFSFIRKLTESAYEEKRKFPPVELIVYPSVGHKGHGTPPEIFRAGCEWLLQKSGMPKAR
jgi:alpha/beta superfamily hydrolase